MAIVDNLARAARTLRKSPGFAAAVISILGLGIGANTAVFSLVNTALLRPLPYRDSAQLVFVTAAGRSTAGGSGCLSYPHFILISTRNRTFTGIAAFTNENLNWTNREEAVQLQAARVSSNFFSVLGTSMAMGRAFTSDEGQPGGKLAVVLGDAFCGAISAAIPPSSGTPLRWTQNRTRWLAYCRLRSDLLRETI